MLRRSKTIVFDDDPAPSREEPVEQAPRPTLRRNVETLRATPPRPAPAPEFDTGLADVPEDNPVHQRFDYLRSELEQAPISKGSQESLAALREEFRRKHAIEDDAGGPSLPSFSLGGIRASRLLLVAVAILAGGLAAWLALGRQPEPAPAPVVQVAPEPPPPAPTLEVLVARQSIPVGTRLSADLLEWQKWPEETVRTEYITSAAAPEAVTEFGDTVARSEIIAGEPIRREKLGQAGSGYLSAILQPGMRAVSVAIGARSASGGFIMPNDRVDVVLTSSSEKGQVSRTILSDVRVLAINARLGNTSAQDSAPTPEEGMFSNEALATLELNPAQAELIINATSGGSLSLVLRPISDSAGDVDAAEQAINQSIRMTSPFWLGAPESASGGMAPTY